MADKTDWRIQLISGSNGIKEKFGYWPDFHDFEVLHLIMDRNGPDVLMEIYGFNTSQETDEKKCFKRINECIITLKFNIISDILLKDYNQQNVISELDFREQGGLLRTEISASFGLCGYIVSKNAEIVDIKDI